MTHGSLFSGIGGFDLAAEWMGWENVFSCEINPFGRRVLKYYWPNATHYEDITTTDFTIWRGRIDILTGGFPCQPFSQAGKRKGTEDDRHLWPRMLEVIREIQPRWVVGENVYGLTNWDGGLVFEQVCLDLENEGYEVQPVILPAASVNAPHRRDRVWFVAYRAVTGREEREQSNGRENGTKDRTGMDDRLERYGNEWSTPDTGLQRQEERQQSAVQPEGLDDLSRNSTDTCGQGLEGRPYINKWEEHNIKRSGSKHGARASSEGNGGPGRPNFDQFQTQSPVCGRDDGVSCRLDGITFPKWRNESIKAYGNAIVPQVAYEIFKVIDKIHTKSKHNNQ